MQNLRGYGSRFNLNKGYGRTVGSLPVIRAGKALKENVKVLIQLHTHYTSGVGSMTYLKGIEAGADIVDCAISPMAMGTSQPPEEPLVASLQGTPYDTGYDLNLLSEIAAYYEGLRNKYLSSGLLNTKVMGVDVMLIYQVPGGMLSNRSHSLNRQARKMLVKF